MRISPFLTFLLCMVISFAYAQSSTQPLADLLPARLMLTIFVGWLSYWVVKIPRTIMSKSNPVTTVKEFVETKWRVILLSFLGLVLILLMGNDLPKGFGEINSIYTAFITGGAIPSWSMNFFPDTTSDNN